MYIMKRYTVAEVRERLASALDEAESGIPVVIERRRVRFRLSVEHAVKASRRRKPRITVLDPALLSGDWEWRWTPRGVSLAKQRRVSLAKQRRVSLRGRRGRS